MIQHGDDDDDVNDTHIHTHTHTHTQTEIEITYRSTVDPAAFEHSQLNVSSSLLVENLRENIHVCAEFSVTLCAFVCNY